MSYERSKAPLALMEQIIMVLVFALTSAVCLQAFVYSNRLSEEGQLKELAATRAQTVIEYCKASQGDWEQVCAKLQAERTETGIEIDYPEDKLEVKVDITESTEWMERAKVEVWQTDDGSDGVWIDYAVPAYTIETAWQKGGQR
ncbi:MAG: hypothetical protein J1F22_06450 [Lachnospiraceae bacterium]|nr:hypothetical protein [Lachnospiraceae bacterium]